MFYIDLKPYTTINYRTINKRSIMSKMIEKRWLEFIPRGKYEKLDEEERQNLLSYRRSYSKCVVRQKKIERMKNEIVELNEELKEWMLDLTSQNHFIEHLRTKYSFSCSVVSLTPRPSGKVYYNLTISRKGDYPKNCSLGSEETIKDHLLEYYKGKSKVRKEIKKDWKGWLRKETKSENYPKTYQRILDMILNNPLGFKNETINREVLFPLDK
jgi:hypothetical protein